MKARSRLTEGNIIYFFGIYVKRKKTTPNTINMATNEGRRTALVNLRYISYEWQIVQEVKPAIMYNAEPLIQPSIPFSDILN